MYERKIANVHKLNGLTCYTEYWMGVEESFLEHFGTQKRKKRSTFNFNGLILFTSLLRVNWMERSPFVIEMSISPGNKSVAYMRCV